MAFQTKDKLFFVLDYCAGNTSHHILLKQPSIRPALSIHAISGPYQHTPSQRTLSTHPLNPPSLLVTYPGGELFFHLGKVGRFPEDRARFYAAQITLALEHIHSQGMSWWDMILYHTITLNTPLLRDMAWYNVITHKASYDVIWYDNTCTNTDLILIHPPSNTYTHALLFRFVPFCPCFKASLIVISSLRMCY